MTAKRARPARGGAAAALDPDALRVRLAAHAATPEDPLGALAALEARWGEDPELEAAVVDLVANASAPEAASRLDALAARTTHKDVKREIKRALYKLEQRGLWRPPEAQPRPARELLGPDEDEPEAWLSAIDPGGSRLVWMARRTGQGMASLSALLNEQRGLEEFFAGETTRKMLRQAQRDLVARSGVALVDVPWRHADALLMRALTRSHERAKHEPQVTRARREIVPRPSGGPVALPIDALLDRDEAERDPAALAASGAVLAEKELAGWLLPAEWIDAVLGAITDAQTSVLVISPQQRDERLRAAVEGAAEEVFAPAERRETFASRLEETAYLLARRGRLDAARALVAAAGAARGGRAIAEIPVLAQLAIRSIGLRLEREAEQAREESRSSLIMTPAQVMEEQRQRSLRRGR